MNGEADRIIEEMSMKEIPRRSNGAIDVEKYREFSWRVQRATSIKMGHIEDKIKDNKVVKRLAYFSSIGLILVASSIVFIHAGWGFATGTLSGGAIIMKILSLIKHL